MHLASLYRELWRCRCPIYEENIFHWSEMRHVWVKRFVLPLTADGADPEFAVGAQLFSSRIEDRTPLRRAFSLAEIELLSADHVDPLAARPAERRHTGG
jgi:hypothetical protein